MSQVPESKAIIQSIKDSIPSWKNFDEEKFTFERFYGLTNLIWKISVKDNQVKPQSIIYREFGKGWEMMDRKTENYVFEILSKEEISPHLYTANQKFRLEEYLDYKELDSSLVNTPKFRLKIAFLLDSLHRVKIDKIDKTPNFKKFLSCSDIFTKFADNLKELEKKVGLDSPNLLSMISKQEIDFFKDSLPLNPESLCFSHNDLHSRNMLYSHDLDNILLIDFEYAGYNYRGYDIANIFNESIIDYKYSETPYFRIDITKFPSDSDLIEFIQYYVWAGTISKEEKKNLEKLDQEKLDSLIKSKLQSEEFHKKVQKIFEEVILCLMYSHFYWGVWSIIQSLESANSKFDYVKFATERFLLYKEFKQIFLSKYSNYWSLKEKTQHDNYEV